MGLKYSEIASLEDSSVESRSEKQPGISPTVFKKVMLLQEQRLVHSSVDLQCCWHLLRPIGAKHYLQL